MTPEPYPRPGATNTVSLTDRELCALARTAALVDEASPLVADDALKMARAVLHAAAERAGVELGPLPAADTTDDDDSSAEGEWIDWASDIEIAPPDIKIRFLNTLMDLVLEDLTPEHPYHKGLKQWRNALTVHAAVDRMHRTGIHPLTGLPVEPHNDPPVRSVPEGYVGSHAQRMGYAPPDPERELQTAENVKRVLLREQWRQSATFAELHDSYRDVPIYPRAIYSLADAGIDLAGAATMTDEELIHAVDKIAGCGPGLGPITLAKLRKHVALRGAMETEHA